MQVGKLISWLRVGEIHADPKLVEAVEKAQIAAKDWECANNENMRLHKARMQRRRK